MRSIYLFVFACAISLIACKSGNSGTTEATPAAAPATTSAPTTPASTGLKPPFEIADSSKVMELEGGVKLYILEQGAGVAPTIENKVLAKYHGRLLNGNVFDSSYERGVPAEFALRQVIKGWQVAFPQLKPGARAVIIIPSAMGYGAQGQGAKIPGNSTLIFDVELITTT